MRKGKKFFNNREPKTRINKAIRAKELRVVTDSGETLGVLSLSDALQAAEDRKLDLIEISPKATPPVAKIMDYGKFRYDTGRKAREIKAKSHVTETKNAQVKIGTSENDQSLKAKRIAEWLQEGHRVKVDLFLWGRYKYMEADFLKERLNRFLKIIPCEYKIADDIKKSPKGFTATIEFAGVKQKPAIVKNVVVEKVAKKQETEQKRKKRSLDELLEEGMV